MRKSWGQLRRITDLQAFIKSWLTTGGKPTAGHAPWGKTPVRLVCDFPDGQFSGGFLPPTSLKTDTDADGNFDFDVPDAFNNFRGQIVAYDETKIPPPIPNMPPLPVLNPVYRSAPFKITALTEVKGKVVAVKRVPIYVLAAATPDELGIDQSALDKETTALRKSLKLDSLAATILADCVRVRAKKSGGDLRFSARVRGSTSASLDQVIDVKAGEIDISSRAGLKKLSAKISAQLLDELAKKAPALGSLASVSVWRTRHVQSGTRTIKMPPLPTQKVPVYSVVPDAAFGVPRVLY
ncbi:MAG: hypothetical protein CFE45_11105 [Burkholderiales bacterium PBB5]|nr:MAG: hypothetical protein CFE45_11105 [Burkholderiales bacterium PBB5]